jgi:hypothetical protein
MEKIYDDLKSRSKRQKKRVTPTVPTIINDSEISEIMTKLKKSTSQSIDITKEPIVESPRYEYDDTKRKANIELLKARMNKAKVSFSKINFIHNNINK